ncbi:MAG: electron transport complex subunit RsxD [Gammaproteobacteria bacterium]|nr:electron transport complex subunit RsxD [Gammaproteobacteria bacterium]
MLFKTTSSPYISTAPDVSAVMRQVLYALVPGTLASIWYFGWGVLINLVLAILFAISLEAIMLKLRGRPIKPFLSDYSAVVTAWLFTLALPPLAPWWLILIGIFFAIVVAKHLYGGLGYNPFNPAMVGYVVLLISFPREMTLWLPPSPLAEHHLSLMESLRVVFTGALAEGLTWDAITMATPLDEVKTGLSMERTITEIRTSPLFGDFGGVGWEWIRNWFAIGGLWLLYKRVADWRIPLAVIIGLGLVATPFYLTNPDSFASPAFHVFSGAVIVGAFFIATDPVSASTTPNGRWIYGLGIGILIYIIRTWGGYPDGVAFAVLLMNMAAPTIDYFTKPRVYGEVK